VATEAPLGIGGTDFAFRGWRADDVDAVFEARQDDALQTFLAGMPVPFTRDDALRYVRFDMAQPGRFVIAKPETDALLGSIWLDEPRGVPEVGFWLTPNARGRGLASRAVASLSRWAVGARGLSTIEMVTHPANTAAQAVALRAGFERAGEVEYAAWPDGETRGARYVWARSSP